MSPTTLDVSRGPPTPTSYGQPVRGQLDCVVRPASASAAVHHGSSMTIFRLATLSAMTVVSDGRQNVEPGDGG